MGKQVGETFVMFFSSHITFSYFDELSARQMFYNSGNDEEDVEEEALTGDPESIVEGDDNLKEEEEKSGGVETDGVDDGLMQ